MIGTTGLYYPKIVEKRCFKLCIPPKISSNCATDSTNSDISDIFTWVQGHDYKIKIYEANIIESMSRA